MPQVAKSLLSTGRVDFQARREECPRDAAKARDRSAAIDAESIDQIPEDRLKSCEIDDTADPEHLPSGDCDHRSLRIERGSEPTLRQLCVAD